MARRRMICPAIWESEDFSKLSHLSRILFIGMFSNADDYGKGKANPALLKSKIFAFDGNVRTADIEKSLQEIATNMSTYIYLAQDDVAYYQMVNWKKWQTVNKPTESILPDYNSTTDTLLYGDYGSTTVGVHDKSSSDTVAFNSQEEEKGKVKEKEGERKNDCSEQNSEPTLQEAIIHLILNTGNEYVVCKQDYDTWCELYPAVDIIQCLRNMQGWLLANPKRRKTDKGIKRFITTWLQKEQDKGGSKGYTGKPSVIDYANALKEWVDD